MTASALLVRPAFCSHPPYERTLGPEVRDLCRDVAGFDPDPEQELGLDLIFAIGADGRSAAFEIAVICSRQNLKTGLYKMAALGWLFVTEERLVVWSAHEFPTSAEAFRDISELIDGSDWLRRQVRTIYRGHGDESVELVDGRRLIFKTRTKGGGRGLTGDKVVLDEGMFLQPQHMGALLPTLSARPDPQVLYGASAGLAESSVLRGVRDRGRVGGDRKLAYLEWCDDLPGGCGSPQCSHALGSSDCRLDDPLRWARSNPTLDRPRANGTGVTSDYVAAERRALPPEEFARERLGWWDDPLSELQPIPPAEFAACFAARNKPSGLPVFFLDASPGLRSASIAVASADEADLPHVELWDHRPGATWMVDEAVGLKERNPNALFCLDATGPASTLIPKLIEAGITPEEFPAGDMARGCVHLQHLVSDRALTITEHPSLLTAIGGAVKRDYGDGLWTWGRRKSTVDISPIEAVTGAVWGHAKFLEAPTPEIF